MYKNTQLLIVTPEPLPETGVLANHSSDFSLAKRTASQQAVHTYLFREVASRPKKIVNKAKNFFCCMNFYNDAKKRFAGNISLGDVERIGVVWSGGRGRMGLGVVYPILTTTVPKNFIELKI